MSAYLLFFFRKFSALLEKKGPIFSSLFVIGPASTLKREIYWNTARWITQKIPLGRDTSRLAYHFRINLFGFHRMSLSHHVAQNGFKSMLTAVRPVQFCSNYWFTTLERARMFDSSRRNLILDFTGHLRCCTNHLLSLHFSVLVCDGVWMWCQVSRVVRTLWDFVSRESSVVPVVWENVIRWKMVV